MNKPISFLVAAVLSLGLSSSLHADNRFSSSFGGGVNGTGSMGEGSVTIHHNLLPEERAELEAQIVDLDTRVTLLEGKVETLEGQVETQNSQIIALTNNLNAVSSRADSALQKANHAHERIDNLSSTSDPSGPAPCGSGGSIAGDCATPGT